MTIATGYTSNLGLSTTFRAAAELLGFAQPQPSQAQHQSVTLTDIMPNTTFHVQTVNPKDTISTHGNVNNVQVANTSVEVKNDVNAVEASYKEAHNQAMNAIGDAMKQAVGAERAGAVMAHLRPRGAEGALIEGARPVVDHYMGMAGSLYEVMNAVRDHVSDAEVNEVLTNTLRQLHEISEKQHSEFAADSKKTPPTFDFKAIKSPEQLKQFIARDITKDPVMKQVADARVGIEKLEKNEEVAAEVVELVEAKERQFGAFGVKFTSGSLAEAPPVNFAEALEVDPSVKAKLKHLTGSDDLKPPIPAAPSAAIGAIA
jgi:DNA-binding protein YbaB